MDEVIAGAEQDKQYRVERSAYSKYTPPVLSETGLVLLSADYQTIRALDHNNTVLWEFNPISSTFYNGDQTYQVGRFRNYLKSSLDGRFIMFANGVSQSTERISHLIIVVDSERGFPRLMKHPEYDLRFSSTGEYLISGVYRNEGTHPTPVTTYKTDSGRTLWIHDVKAVDIAELGSNEVAYINTADRNAVLTIVELTTGEHVLTIPIKWMAPEDSRRTLLSWNLTTSKDGTRVLVSVSDSSFDGPSPSFEHTVMFDREGRPLWTDMRKMPSINDVALGINTIGFSPDSRYQLIYRYQRMYMKGVEPIQRQLIMADTDTRDVLWSLNVDSFYGYDLMLMTDKHIVLSHSYRPFTLILSLDESGQIHDQAKLDRRIVWTGLHVDKPVSDMPQKRYRHSFLFEEVEQDSITYSAEYIPYKP
ncbi:MAG: hypothetical protein F4Z29_04925 [Gemmatimonadetes bacterium]|nr:hypothetical protein [Gemmatimonadota bacterium]